MLVLCIESRGCWSTEWLLTTHILSIIKDCIWYILLLNYWQIHWLTAIININYYNHNNNNNNNNNNKNNNKNNNNNNKTIRN